MEKDSLELLKQYFEQKCTTKTTFCDTLNISSDNSYVFFEEKKTQKIIALFSKKYYITVELYKKEENKGLFSRFRAKKEPTETEINIEKIAEVIDAFRQEKGIEIKRYEFWIPHCIVNNDILKTRYIASSYGASSDLALEYLSQYDKFFALLYDKEKGTYMGLPVMTDYYDAENYEVKDYTKVYMKYWNKLQEVIN